MSVVCAVVCKMGSGMKSEHSDYATWDTDREMAPVDDLGKDIGISIRGEPGSEELGTLLLPGLQVARTVPTYTPIYLTLYRSPNGIRTRVSTLRERAGTTLECVRAGWSGWPAPASWSQ